MGKVFVQLTSIFAELERNVIKERIADSRIELKAQGRWGGGGGIHYGLKVAPLKTGGYELVLDDVGADWINQAADWVIGGSGIAAVCRRLNAKGVLAPKDRQRQLRGRPIEKDEWQSNTLAQIFRSKTLLGWETSEDGTRSTQVKTPPIMSALKFQQLQIAMENLARPKSRPDKKGSAPLSGLVVCGVCMEPLWFRAQFLPAKSGPVGAGKTYRYYHCKVKGHSKQLRAGELEKLFEGRFLELYADVKVTEPVIIPATDYDEQIAEAELAVENLGQQLAVAKSPTMQRILGQQLEEWDAKLTHYQSLPTTQGGIQHVPTGRTWAQELESLDVEGKRELWKRVGVRLAIASHTEGFFFGVNPPEGHALEWITGSEADSQPTEEDDPPFDRSSEV